MDKFIDDMEETWKDIYGLYGYQVSNWGNVKSIDRIITTEHYHRGRRIIGINLKLRYDKDGYAIINIRKDGKGRILKVHRLVAESFIPNIDNKPCIDHINGVRDDNRVENLRWCTVKENASFNLAIKNKSEAIRKSYVNNEELRQIRANTFRKTNSKPVLVFINEEFYKEYESQMDASRDLGLNNCLISLCLLGKRKNIKSFTFKRK